MMYFTTAGMKPLHTMTEELARCEYHLTAWDEGYVPVKVGNGFSYGEPMVEVYSGRFGEGFKIHYPALGQSTRFHQVAYYIRREAGYRV